MEISLAGRFHARVHSLMQDTRYAALVVSNRLRIVLPPNKRPRIAHPAAFNKKVRHPLLLAFYRPSAAA